MYGFLDFEPETGQGLTAIVPAWVTMTERVSEQEYGRRKRTYLHLVSELCRDDPDLAGQVLQDLLVILAHGPKLPNEFAVHMCVAHHRLPLAHRDKRMGTIQRIVDGHFSDLQHPTQAMALSMTYLKQRAILVPDAMLEDELRSACFDIAFAFSNMKPPPAGYDAAPFTVEMNTQLNNQSIPKQEEVLKHLSQAWLSRAPAERLALRKKTLDLLEQKKGKAVAAACVQLAIWPKTLPLLNIHRFDFYESVINDALTYGSDQWSTLTAAHATVLEDKIRTQTGVVLWTSVAAVVAGVPMGAYSASSVDGLQRRSQASTAVRAAFTPTRTQKARALRASEAHALAEREAQELNTVQAMSIDQLARWIEGPIVEPSQPDRKPIDRKVIAQREQAIRQRAPQPKATPTKEPSPEKPLTDEDIEETIRDALSATARFFLGEINDLLVLSKSIGAAPALVAACVGERDLLTQLIHKPEGPNDEEARNILSNAESAVVALRKGLKEAQASASVRSLFPVQLSTALSKEPKVLGKRHGGQIDCPVRFDDWAYVANTFHRRWLPSIKSIEVDGKTMPLDNNQAAALYVTGSSFSGAAFDVSVHLWRRRQGRTSLPSLENGPYPPMNEADWFDTYQTCCVLHVPIAH